MMIMMMMRMVLIMTMMTTPLLRLNMSSHNQIAKAIEANWLTHFCASSFATFPGELIHFPLGDCQTGYSVWQSPEGKIVNGPGKVAKLI